LLMGKVDFSNWFIVLKPGADGVRTFTTMADAQAAGATTLNLGLFLNAIISFVIVAFCVFLLIKAINKLNKPAPAPAAAPTTKKCPFCCTDIPLEATRCPHCTSEIK
ncbi:MAG: MscL family protein, partial [Elusimicrobiaceae bacterium]|nr:MscL family protein [Elusimicrobiaceae bacterium]